MRIKLWGLQIEWGTERRCETCRSWTRDAAERSLGNCGHKVELPIAFEVKRLLTEPGQGADCPCYRRRDACILSRLFG